MAARSPRAKLLERMVLRQLWPLVPEGEQLLAWAHVLSPDGKRGILMLTSACCVAHWPQRFDMVMRWDQVTSSRLEGGRPGELHLVLQSASADIAVRLTPSSRRQMHRTAQVLRKVGELTPSGVLDNVVGQTTAEFPLKHRGVRGHVRRVAVTTLGSLLLLLGLAFTTPFIPGPGFLTILAGLALLASEYDWAKDLHHWARNHLERFRRRVQAWRERRRARRRAG